MYIVINGQKYGKKNPPAFVSSDEVARIIKYAIEEGKAGKNMSISLRTSF